MPKPSGYVVCVCTTVQDGHEEYERVFGTLDRALAWINDHTDPFGATNTFKLFELGKEVPLAARVEEVHKPAPEPERKTVYSVRG